MRWLISILALAILAPQIVSTEQDKVKYNKLNDKEKYVIIQKGRKGLYW